MAGAADAGGPTTGREAARVVLEVDGVCCAYGAEPVLEGVRLRVVPGELVALVGPNGAGKTSLLRALAGLLAPRRGAVWVGGREVRSLGAAERARSLAVVPAEGVGDAQLAVEEAVALGRLPHRGPLAALTPTDRAAVRWALAATGLAGLADRPLCRLSGGEAQRVLLARALAQEPRVLLLDEPTAHLDLGHQAAFLGLVRRLAAERGLAAVAALHDLNLASLYADRLLLLHRGRVVAAGAPAAVLTAERVGRVYGVAVLVHPHPLAGRPQVFLAPPDAGGCAAGAEGGWERCGCPAS